MRKLLLTPFLLLIIPLITSAQNFYFGNDISSANQLEDCGAVFKEGGQPKDVFQIFADRGTNLIRVRLWVDPSWWQSELTQPAGVKPYYNDLVDVKKTITRAKAKGMKVMLGIHYSDFWADPQHQLIPRAWLDDAYNVPALANRVYNYTVDVLTELDNAGLMPDLVKVGNENNAGILSQIPAASPSYETAVTVATWEDWDRHSQLFNAAIRGVRDVGAHASINPKIVIHFTGTLNGQTWNYNNLITSGVTDFDIMGISYYVSWHGGSIGELQSTLATMKSTWPQYDVMVAETGYLWSKQNYDGCANIVTTGDNGYNPVSPENQMRYMVDYTQAVIDAGGVGVVFWEPAWVSTPCSTPWCVGSSHDHLAFFDPVNTNVMENGAINWTRASNYTFPSGSNQAPSANAGTDKNLSAGTTTTTLSGSGSDPDNDPITFQWTKVSGPSATIANPNNASTGISGLSSGNTYVFRLTVSDGSLSSSDEVQVTVAAGTTTSMHVENIATGTQNAGGGKKRGIGWITVYNNLESPVVGAVVTGTFSGTFNQTVSGTTDATGTATLVTSGSAKGTLVVNLCATSVTHSSLTYNSSANHITCTGSGARVAVETSSEEESAVFSVYPNPTDGFMNLTLAKTSESLKIRLTDLSGKNIKSIKSTQLADRHYQLDLSGIGSGVYLIEVISDFDTSIQKIVIK